MNAAQTVTLLYALGAWLVLGWTAVVGIPLLARSVVVARVAQARDDVVDACRSGALPLGHPGIEDFRRASQAISDAPEEFGLSEMYAVHEARRRNGHHHPEHGYDDLSPLQSEMMRTQERIVGRAVSSYLIWGSRFWPLLLGVLLAGQVVRRVVRVVSGTVPEVFEASPKELAQDARDVAATPRGQRLALAG